MKFIDKEDLPVEVKNNELPKDIDKHYELFYDEKVRTSGGFTDAMFLASVIIVAFMWGMLIMAFR